MHVFVNIKMVGIRFHLSEEDADFMHENSDSVRCYMWTQAVNVLLQLCSKLETINDTAN